MKNENKKSNWHYVHICIPIVLVILNIAYMIACHIQSKEIEALNRDLETYMTLGETLEPCPMCGSEELSIEINDHGDYFIECEDCHAISGITWSHFDDPFTLQDAINHWNNLPGRNEEEE